jgi:hypothetical protein
MSTNNKHLFIFDNSIWTDGATLSMPNGDVMDFGKCAGLHCKFRLIVFPTIDPQYIEDYINQKLIGYDRQMVINIVSLINNYVNNLKQKR